MIYLDNASTTQIDKRVLEAMMPYLTDQYGNAGTLYGIGRNASNAINKAREQVAYFLNAKPEQIIFTSGGSESNNMVFSGVKDYLVQNVKRQVITTQIEHESILKAVDALYKTKDGFDTAFLRPSETGMIQTQFLEHVISDKTGLVSVMHTNNETGVENPVKEIADISHRYGALFHTDAIQAAGCCKLDVEDIGCDFLSLSGHKMHAPKGIGALYVRDISVLSPLIYGGAVQEFGMRGGTENVAGIVGLGEACRICSEPQNVDANQISCLKDEFKSMLLEELDRKKLTDIIHINGEPSSNGKTINIRIDGIDSETMVLMLDAAGVCVSAGSACRSHESEPSYVLTAMGISEEDARNSIRISFSRMNTLNEVTIAVKKIVNCIVELKNECA